MSQSRAAKYSTGDLKAADLLLAVLLHALVLTIILVLAQWQQQHKQEPLKRIEVMMISAQQLANLEQQAHNKPRSVAKKRKPPVVKKKPKVKPVVTSKPKPKPIPVVKPRPVPKPKPVIKPKPIAKPATISKPKRVAKAATRPDADFDPFAPVASSSDHTAKRAKTTRPDLADVAGKQLSTREKERYIAMMQAAVQDHWKVAASTGSFSDPLVEMQLRPNGDVASVRILESSGNRSLDDSLIRAIRAAAPFQLPKKQFEFFRINRLRFHPLK